MTGWSEEELAFEAGICWRIVAWEPVAAVLDEAGELVGGEIDEM